MSWLAPVGERRRAGGLEGVLCLSSIFPICGSCRFNHDLLGRLAAAIPPARSDWPGAESEPLFIPQVVEVCRQSGIGYVVLIVLRGQPVPTPENLRWFPRSVAAYAEFRWGSLWRPTRCIRSRDYTAVGLART